MKALQDHKASWLLLRTDLASPLIGDESMSYKVIQTTMFECSRQICVMITYLVCKSIPIARGYTVVQCVRCRLVHDLIQFASHSRYSKKESRSTTLRELKVFPTLRSSDTAPVRNKGKTSCVMVTRTSDRFLFIIQSEARKQTALTINSDT